MILSAEVMREYDQRFVYKKVFGIRVDRAVQTNEGQLNGTPARRIADECSGTALVIPLHS